MTDITISAENEITVTFEEAQGPSGPGVGEAVLYSVQSLSTPEQLQARENIAAQEASPILAAIAALSLISGSMIYATGANTVAAAPTTSFGRSVLNVSDAAAGRTLFGAVSQSDVDTSIASLVASAPSTLDTLKELADALGDDPAFATTTATALGNRVRFDAAQTLTSGQKTQAQANIGIDTVIASLGYFATGTDASHLTGTVASARVSGAYSGITGVGTLASGAVPTSLLTGTLANTQFPALTGDVTTTAGSLATAIGATKVTNAMINADHYSAAHTWSALQTYSANVIFSADNTYDIGASGATRPRNVYVAGNVTAGGLILPIGGSAAPFLLLAGSANTQTGVQAASNNLISFSGAASNVGTGAKTAAFYFDTVGSWLLCDTIALDRINQDVVLGRAAAATLRVGNPDAASPVPQTIKFQDVGAGTTNTAGVNATIQAPAGTGTGAGGAINLQVAPAGSTGSSKNAWVTAWQLAGTGHLLCPTDTTYDIGANGGSRPRNLWIGGTGDFRGTLSTGGAINAGGTIIGAVDMKLSSGHFYYWNNLSLMTCTVDGNVTFLNTAQTGFTSLQLGGTTTSYPALKRSATSLQARLADDSAFTNIQGKLTTIANAVAETIVPDHTLVLYDAAGTAYRVPCQV